MGIFRVRMQELPPGNDWLELLMPLDGNAELDVSAPDPIGLFKGIWTNGSVTVYCGEVKVQPTGVVLEWFGEHPETTPIDLENKPIRVGGVFTINAAQGKFRYAVKKVQPG
jgi:hypothetical protein